MLLSPSNENHNGVAAVEFPGGEQDLDGSQVRGFGGKHLGFIMCESCDTGSTVAVAVGNGPSHK